MSDKNEMLDLSVGADYIVPAASWDELHAELVRLNQALNMVAEEREAWKTTAARLRASLEDVTKAAEFAIGCAGDDENVCDGGCIELLAEALDRHKE